MTIATVGDEYCKDNDAERQVSMPPPIHDILSLIAAFLGADAGRNPWKRLPLEEIG